MRLLAAGLLLALATPALAQQPITRAQRAVPAQLDEASRAAFAQAFRDVAAGRLASAKAVADANPNAVLTPALRAELLLAAKKPRADAIAELLSASPDLPQAARLAARAGRAADLPDLAQPRALRIVSSTAPIGPRSVRPDTPQSAAFVAAVRPLVGSGQADAAEALWRARAAEAGDAVRSEWAQRIAWDQFGAGNDEAAIRMGDEASRGVGEWAAMGAWTAGLAAWRAGDCLRAAERFDRIVAGPDDLLAAARYWASRAWLACGKPKTATARLKAAADSDIGFYGILARRALGIEDKGDWREPDFIQADWNTLARMPGARRAAALVEIGQLGLADRELKHLAATGDVTAYEPLLRLAARLNMPATQYWLAHRPPVGQQAPLAARFPAPEWTPYRGWRVDKALVFAHALQESNFVTDATSRAGARGIMQLMPGTARDLARGMGEDCDVDRLARDPEFNIEYGQSYLEKLRDMPWTQGLLPKVVAAYNAGPGSVQRWNTTLKDNGDPLLFLESIPFRETRHYVEVVLRNYWKYQQRQGAAAPSLDAYAANLWPRFPGLPGATAVKVVPAMPSTATAVATLAAPAPDGAPGAN
jgi:soluble lytic murein transglycosylase-like protein